MGYLGLLHTQYFYYLYSETLKPEPIENLIILLLNSRYYINLSIVNSWNPPTAYFTLANIEYELHNLKTNGILSSSIPVNYEMVEKYLTISLQLNEKLIQLSNQGIPVQDLIDPYAAYNQLGVYYLSKSEEVLKTMKGNDNY